MRLSDFTMSMLLAVPLALAGCDNGNGDEGAGSSTGDDTTTTSDDTTTTSDDTTTTGEDTGTSTTSGVGMACLEEQVIPEGPDCAGADGVIDGSVILEEGDDVTVLEGVGTVNGSIRINRIDAENLDFMQCVHTVTGDVTIFGNENLTNVDGLWSLTAIGTDFIFSENTAILDFNGLPNISGIENNLIMKNNDSLQSISGFHSLIGIEGNLTIQNNDSLVDVDGLGGLTLVNGTLAITANPSLCQSSVNCVGEGISIPAVPPPEWSTQGNNTDC